MATLNFGRDVQGYNSFASEFAPDKVSATIAAAGNATATVPSNYKNWILSFSFQPGSDCWVALNTTAAPPVGATFATTSSELLPGARIAQAGDTVNVYNSGAGSADVGIMFYAVS